MPEPGNEESKSNQVAKNKLTKKKVGRKKQSTLQYSIDSTDNFETFVKEGNQERGRAYWNRLKDRIVFERMVLTIDQISQVLSRVGRPEAWLDGITKLVDVEVIKNFDIPELRRELQAVENRFKSPEHEMNTMSS